MASLACWLTLASLVSSQGQPAGGSDRVVRIRPELPPGTEWLYRGQVTENYQSGQAEYSRAYRLETRALALGDRQGKRTVAILTQLREKENSRAINGQSPAATTSSAATTIASRGSSRERRACCSATRATARSRTSPRAAASSTPTRRRSASR